MVAKSGHHAVNEIPAHFSFRSYFRIFPRFSFVDFGYVGQSYGVTLSTPCS